MIKQLRKKYIITSLLSVFALLTTILLVINLVNFSLVTSDADRVLDQMVAQGGAFPENFVPNAPEGMGGQLQPDEGMGGGDFDPRGPKGPDSPELGQTTRFFTVTFDRGGGVVDTTIKMNISQQKAVEWAQSLADKKSGWSEGYYRYRVWKNGNQVSVTVIDQSRELLPSYRVLVASCVGEAVGLLVTLLVLIYVARLVSDPVEKSDRKQKRFIEDAAVELKNPIVAIDAMRLAIEERQGQTQETRMIAEETRHLAKVVQGLDALLLIENASTAPKRKDTNLSEVLGEILAEGKCDAQNQGKTLESDVQENVVLCADEAAIERLVSIAVKNAVDYAHSKVVASLRKEGERVVLEFANDTQGVQDGPMDSVFERFWRSPTVRDSGLDGAGLGLSVAKEIVSQHGGRIQAAIQDGWFRLKIEL